MGMIIVRDWQKFTWRHAKFSLLITLQEVNPLSMNAGTKNMDFLSKHWGAYERDFPGLAPVQTIGYQPRKTEWVDRTFPTTNFSFILSGGGLYHYGGRTWKIVAPCVITQWPGPTLQYGPAGEFETWEELYLVYRPDLRPKLEQANLFSPDRPVWKIHALERFHKLLEELQTVFALDRQPEFGLVDRIDRLCEQLILESLISNRTHPPSPMEQKLAAIREHLQNHFQEPVDWQELAARHGFSLTSFRRHWRAGTGTSPARFLSRLRLNAARRLLVETDLPINEIALQTGFQDPLYFSRKFSKEFQVSARQYRQSFRG